MGLLIKLFIGIILTAISYMAIPLIALLINNGRFEEKHAKRIALWNSVILGVIFCIITINLSDTNATWNAAPAILYYGINCALLTKKGKKERTIPTPVSQPCPPPTALHRSIQNTRSLSPSNICPKDQVQSANTVRDAEN